MTLLLLLAFFGLCAGCLSLLNLSPRTLLKELTRLLTHIQPRKPPIGKRIRAIQRPKKLKGWRATIQEAKAILRQTGQSGKLGLLTVSSLMLAIAGAILALLFKK